MASTLDRRSDNFDERNPLLWLALGLLGFGRRIEALVGAQAGSPATAPGEPEAHPWDDAVLGAIALQLRIVAHVERLCPMVTGADSTAPPAEARSSTLRELLR